MSLTDSAIKALRPAEKRFKAFDSGGLYLEVLPSGSKVWRLKYRWERKDKRLTIGPYPSVTLKDARKQAQRAKNVLESGRDPAAEKSAEDKAVTFEAVTREWIEKQSARWSDVHKSTVCYRLERFAFQHIGALPIDSVTPQQVYIVFDSWRDRVRTKRPHGYLASVHRCLDMLWPAAIVSRTPVGICAER